MLPFLAIGQFTIKGVITDKETGEPLPGAGILLENTYIATASENDGAYELRNIKKGKYLMQVSFIGYKTAKREINLVDNLSFDIKLDVDPIMQENVIIKATRANYKSPTAYQNIEKADIRKINLGQDIPLLLELTPSVVTTTDAGTGVGYTGLRIRGSDLYRINVTINGIPVNDPESQGVFWVDMPDLASSVDNIQIQRGVGTSTNGSGAFGASINIQTTKLNPDAYAEINSSYGSFNTLKNNVIAGTGLINGKWAFDARLSKITSDGFIDRASSNMKSFFVSGGYYGEKSFLRLNIFSGIEKTYQAWYGVPKDSLTTNRTYNPYTYENQIDHYQQDNYQLIYNYQLNKKLKFNVALHCTYGRGYYEEFQEDDALGNYLLENILLSDSTFVTNSDIIRRKWLDNYFYGITYSFDYETKKINFIFGSAINQYDGDHFGNVIWAEYASNGNINHQYYFNNGLKTDGNIFTKLNYSLSKKFNLFGDFQGRYVSHEIAGVDDDQRDISQTHAFTFFNPKAGIYYDISKIHKAYFSLAIANREPNRNNFADADPDKAAPAPEKLYDYELGYNYIKPKFAANINIYYMKYQDQLVMTGEINEVGYAIMTNVPESYRAGIEFISTIKPVNWIQWDFNATLSQNRILNFTEYIDSWDASWNFTQIVNELGETNIAFSPSVIAGSNLGIKPFKKSGINLMTKYVGKQYIDNTSSENNVINPYLVNNILLEYKIKTKYIKEIGLSLALNNVLNVKYETNAWIYKCNFDNEEFIYDGYYPQAGFNFLGGISLKF